jgi:hypothetical protein
MKMDQVGEEFQNNAPEKVRVGGYKGTPFDETRR